MPWPLKCDLLLGKIKIMFKCFIYNIHIIFVKKKCLYLFLSCYRISDLNMGRLVRGDLSKGFVPPVASAVLDLLENHGEFQRMEISLMFSSYILY